MRGALRLWRSCAVRAVRALVCVLACAVVRRFALACVCVRRVLACVSLCVCVRCVLACVCLCACFVFAPPRAVCVRPRLCMRRAAPPPGPWSPGPSPRVLSWADSKSPI